MAEWMTVPLLHGEGGVPFRRIGLAHAAIAPYGVFKTRDGADILIAIQNDREWRVLAEKVLGDCGTWDEREIRDEPEACRKPGGNRCEGCGLFCASRGCESDEEVGIGRHRLCARQRLGAAVETCAPAPDYGRCAERPGQHAGAGAAARRTGPRLWTDPGTGRAYCDGASGILRNSAQSIAADSAFTPGPAARGRRSAPTG